ncbi:hypothetical protein [Butyrivibrio sp. MC2021]|uniref:hypothetical protein n=1 Tax=Butyrivibrio sp. MC2021 TaxID=1408306 RepID=UPI00047B1C72|nr:hypothetical protein [Butyrivibrio sp. MC2021]
MRKNIITVCMLAATVLSACGKDKIPENSTIGLSSFDEDLFPQNFTEEPAEADDAAITATSEVAKEIEEEEEESLDIEVGKGEIALSFGENEFTAAIDVELGTKEKFCSFVVDLDNDGKNEAFVLPGFIGKISGDVDSEDTLDYVYAADIYFVDEKLTPHLLEGTAPDNEIASKQQYLEIGGLNYITLNGYCGADKIGYVFTLKNDELLNAVPDLNFRGTKTFDENNELFWTLDAHCSYAMTDNTESTVEECLYARSNIPYALYADNGVYKLYGAKEVSFEEANNIASLYDDMSDCVGVQIILRDNNELDVNKCYLSGEDIEFCCNVYKISKTGDMWFYLETYKGFKIVDRSNESNWSILSTKIGDIIPENGFYLGDNMKDALEEIALIYDSFESKEAVKADNWEKDFINFFLQNSYFATRHLNDFIKTRNGILSKKDVESISYDLTGEKIEFKSLSDGDAIDAYNTSSGYYNGNIESWEAEVNGETVTVIGKFKKSSLDGSDVTEYNYTAVLQKNISSIFDGYSIVSMTKE